MTAYDQAMSGFMTEILVREVIRPSDLGALGRRFESCRPDQSETGFPACLF